MPISWIIPPNYLQVINRVDEFHSMFESKLPAHTVLFTLTKVQHRVMGLSFQKKFVLPNGHLSLKTLSNTTAAINIHLFTHGEVDR